MPCSSHHTPVLSAANLCVGYRDKAIINDVTFSINKGDVLAVVGHNGAGKTTLIKTLLGVIPALSGHMIWSQKKQKNAVAYLGQLTEFDRKFPVRVRDIATMGAWHNLGFLGGISRDQQKSVDAALDRCGLTDISHTPIHELSSGQLQRALFARTMVQDAPVILLDEPFAAVDQTTEEKLLSLIGEWSREGRAIVLVLHDLTAVLSHTSKALLVGDGRASFGPTTQVLTPDKLVSHGYMSAGQADWIRAMCTTGQSPTLPDLESLLKNV